MTDRQHSKSTRSSTARAGGQPFAEYCLGRLPAGTILNVGAGLAELRSERQRIINVDLDSEMLRDVGWGIAADVEELPFPDESFDGALMKDVLEHVSDPIGALREVARTCRDSALLTVTVPRAIPRAVWADPTHIRGFTPAALSQAMAMAGWTVVGRIERVGSLPGAGHSDFLLRHAVDLLRIPGLGHWFGLNWMVTAQLSRAPES